MKNLDPNARSIPQGLRDQTAQPLVSVIVPVFNESIDTLRQSLESLRAQTFKNFECLVIDESTHSELAAACRLFCDEDDRFRYLHPEKRLGLAASLNYGIQQAKGKLIARFDSDDICFPDRLAAQVEYLNAHPEIDILGGGMELIDDDGITTAIRHYPEDHPHIERRFHFTTAMAHPTVMMRKDVISQAGGYNIKFRHAEDLELWLRLLRIKSRFANLPQALVQYRQSTTRRSPRHWRYNLLARVTNLRARSILPQLAGLAVIAVWAIMPEAVQVKVFQDLLLREKQD